MEPDRDVRRRRAGEAAGALAVLVVGVVLGLASDSVVVDAVGWGLAGIALIIAVSAVFYEIGAGEDRDRARGRR